MFRRWFGDKTQQHYDEGIAHFNRGDFPAAVEAFERVLQRSQDTSQPYITLARFYRAEALSRLAEHFLRRRQAGRALEYLDEAVREQPGYPDLHFRRGVALLALENPTSAQVAAEEALALNSDFVEARLLLALALAASGRTEPGHEEFERTRQLARRHASPLATRLETWTRMPDLDEVWDALVRVDDHDRRVEEAEAMFARGEWEASRQQFAALVEEHPKFADLRLRLATTQFQLGDDDAARTNLGAALEQNPDFADALVLSGALELRSGSVGRARRHYERARAKGIPSPFADYGLALCHLLLGDATASLMLLQRLLHGDEPPLRARQLTACLLAVVGAAEEARTEFGRLLVRPENDEAILDAVAFALEQRDFDRVEPLLARVKEPRRPEIVVAQAQALAWSGRLEDAADRLDTALSRNPRHPALLRHGAWLAAEVGRSDLAWSRASILAEEGLLPGELVATMARGFRRDADSEAALRALDLPVSVPVELRLERLFALREADRHAEAEALYVLLTRLDPLRLSVRVQDTSRWTAPLAPAHLNRAPQEAAASV